MFVFSVKGKKLKLAAAAAVLLITVIFVISLIGNNDDYTIAYNNRTFSTRVNNAEDVKQFLNQFGWQTENEPKEIVNIRIPSVFNDTYTEYNELQISQGFDLSEYMGETCTKYTYSVLNYPDKDSEVNATVITCGDKVIAADIAESAYNGFMRGLWNEE